MSRISKASSAAIVITCAFMAFYVGVILSSFISDNPSLPLQTGIETGFHASTSAGHFIPAASMPIGSASWIVFVTGTAIAGLPLLICMLMLMRILGHYRVGDIFTLENARRYRNIGLLLLIDALITTPIGDTVRDLAATLNNPPGERILSISVGSTNIYLLFTGAIMFTIALAMQEASRINSENQLTV